MEKNKIKWWELRKGMGIMVRIPGDEHNGVQNQRPGIVVKTHPEYITVQLLSTSKNENDLGWAKINNRKQYIRPIYFKNVTLKQIIRPWHDDNKDIIYISDDSKPMQIIESNPYKSKAITLNLDEYLIIQENIKNLEIENAKLKQENIKKNEQVQELINWNKDLQEENLNFKSKLKIKKNEK